VSFEHGIWYWSSVLFFLFFVFYLFFWFSLLFVYCARRALETLFLLMIVIHLIGRWLYPMSFAPRIHCFAYYSSIALLFTSLPLLLSPILPSSAFFQQIIFSNSEFNEKVSYLDKNFHITDKPPYNGHRHIISYVQRRQNVNQPLYNGHRDITGL